MVEWEQWRSLISFPPFPDPVGSSLSPLNTSLNVLPKNATNITSALAQLRQLAPKLESFGRKLFRWRRLLANNGRGGGRCGGGPGRWPSCWTSWQLSGATALHSGTTTRCFWGVTLVFCVLIWINYSWREFSVLTNINTGCTGSFVTHGWKRKLLISR